jgi:hypothetical protein
LVNEVITYHNQLEKIRNDPAFEEKKKRLLEANKDIQRSTMSEDMEEHFYRRGFRQVELDRSYAAYLTTVLNKVEPIFRTVEELRITLAKHEIPKTGGSTVNRGHAHHRSIRCCRAPEGRPRRFGGTQRDSGT